MPFSYLSSNRAILGSDVHVRFALRSNSPQIVVANKQLDGTDMVGELPGKRQRLADYTRHPRSQRVVETPDVVGFTRQPADRSVLRFENHSCVQHIPHSIGFSGG